MPQEPDDSEAISEWLKTKTERNVKLSVPKIGDKLKLIGMIGANAKKEHKERELKIMRDISFKNNALSSLQSVTGLSDAPMLIEAYDISNISTSHKVASMVTFKEGKPFREKYRNFKIKYVAGQDDYACMDEVLSRRIERGLSEMENKNDSINKFLTFPDVI